MGVQATDGQAMDGQAMDGHLSSEELERALAGMAAARAKEHVAACAACAAEVARFGEVASALKASATERAEVERRRAVAVKALPARRLGAWATAVAVLVVAGAMAPVLRHREAVKAPVAVAAQTPAAANEVSDAELMTKIEDDLASNVPQPMQALEGAGTTGSGKTNSN